MSTEMLPAYLIAGDDTARVEDAVGRFRARAQRDGGDGALEVVSSADASTGPSPAEVIAALGALSLTATTRFVVVLGCERWNVKQADEVAAAAATSIPDLTLALVLRVPTDRKPSATLKKVRAKLTDAVERAGGEAISLDAPKARELPARLVADAGRLGFELELEAARLMVERIGESTARLAHELERLVLWTGDGGRVSLADLEAMIADTSEEAVWALGDAIVSGDGRRAALAAERLLAQGESPTRLVYQVTGRLRDAHSARLLIDQGVPSGEAKKRLRMPGWAAERMLRDVKRTDLTRLRAAACAFADLEWNTRGGSERPDAEDVIVAVRRAVSSVG